MKILVLGPNGMVGSRVVTEAVAAGHHVVGASRSATDVSGCRDERLDRVRVDVADRRALADLVGSADHVVSSLRSTPDENPGLTELTRTLLDVASAVGVPTLIVGGAAPLRVSADSTRLLIDDERFVPAVWRRVARASLDQYRACVEHEWSGWRYLSPPATLEPGFRTGRYRLGSDVVLVDSDGRSWISAEDLAVAVVDQLDEPAGGRHLTVAAWTASA